MVAYRKAQEEGLGLRGVLGLPKARFGGGCTLLVAETLVAYYWLGSFYKGLTVYPCSHTYESVVSVPDKHRVTVNTTCGESVQPLQSEN